ncbi:hypothetical protein TCON_1577 [Astathelohania contejeani]|uniref:Uncharacterized protein n=1 Tax=Astathelohania contejeani TaxID=164912 RepID=A0ABQ7HYI0_9MICR|nr:hypothetical protein TCON_1577 [Thelohania contejeani]
MENEIIKLEPNNYDTVLKELTTIYSETKERILAVLEELAILMPQKCLITSVLFVDLAKTNVDFKNDVVSILQDWLSGYIKEERVEEIICILRLLWILEYFEFLENGTVDIIIKKFDEPRLDHVVKECRIIEAYKTIIWEKSEDGKKQPLNIQFSISESLKNMLSSKLDRLTQIEKFTNTSNGDIYLAKQIFNVFMFDPHECCTYTLKYFNDSQFSDTIAGLFLYLEEKGHFNSMEISLIIKLSKHEYFLKQFYAIIKQTKKSENISEIITNFINSAMAWIYEQYYNGHIKHFECKQYTPENSLEELMEFKSLLNEGVVREMIKYSDCDELIKFLPEELKEFVVIPTTFSYDENVKMLKSSYKNGCINKLKTIEKVDFYHAFFKLTSPSISHFLTYLEAFQSYFILTNDEQTVFCEIMREYVKNKPIYKKIVTNKLLLFKIINMDVATKFPELFGVQ